MEENIDVVKEELKEVKRRLFNTTLKTAMIMVLFLVELFVIGKILIQSGIVPNPGKENKNNIAVLNINKEITIGYVDTLMNKIDKELSKKTTKEFLVIINSPGGSPSASDELSEYLKFVNDKKKVTVYVEAMAASGAYYIASAIKPLNANKNAIIGSIGVIMPHYNLGDLAKKLGVQEDYLAAGKYKKPISYFKPLDKENKEYLKDNLLMPTYKNFIQSVADNRGLSFKEVEKFADGRIYIANDPKIKGILVDNLTNLYKIKEKIKERYKDVSFTDITTEKKGLFPIESKINLNLNTLTDSSILK